MIISQRTFVLLILFGVTNVRCESTKSDVLSYLNVLACTINQQPWECVYQRSGRLFDIIDDALVEKVNELKAEADVEFASKLNARGMSDTEISGLEKPSTMLSSLEDYMRSVFKSVSPHAVSEDSEEGRKMKDKKKKKKKKPEVVEVIQYQKPDIYQLVDEIPDVTHGHGGHFGHGGHHGMMAHIGGGLHKKKYGRSIGGLKTIELLAKLGSSHGKKVKGKKKKRRALMKLLLIGAVLKAKIELLLKIIATHLQIKFFVVAVIGLIVNIARFWVDLKRGQTPQKHVYEDSHDDSWGSSGSSGSYWKRSLPIENNSAENVPVTSSSDRVNQVSYSTAVRQPVNVKQTATYGVSASASSYRQPTTYEEYNASPQLAQYTDPHSIVYSQQMPQQTYSLN
ncbi:uncharacterized protein LOC129576256 isoform X2 [Sitodiplosis mosellana]|uniref:uncharacterized protein LOC129576256 isoform X2 n=1 Tax=Sitodiplosis mosellana TaxID=263140 RepID=UPI002444442D|nr:uncharacterized protein LOC129576256 isoform X2 [Sitodiplosis mosellana]